ncbi:MAG: hypothetical protein OD814_000345 [Candidatus Alkanophagales archaeon MCA70_species_1]|nr:hypothetical protein [Candidatus Alkanophaga volatiphilum]
MEERAIPVPWRRPEREVLLENRYKYSRPPFDPFPTVTNVINASKCPVAILHDILHGIDDITILPGEYGVYNLYQRFIAHLKLNAATGDTPSPSDIRYRFEMFAKDEEQRLKENCWRYYLQPWCNRKLGEIEVNKDIFFEVSVANAYVPFRLGNKNPTYPLRGRIDEIDLKNRRIIERTIKGRRTDEEPPPLKDFQVWLYWKILSSIDKKYFPEAWKNINFKDFELIVETPYNDFIVEKDNPEFERKALIAYAWIKDLADGGKSEFEAYQHRACTYTTSDPECGARWACFGRRYKYPTCRSEIHKEFRKFYPPLFWQQMWDYHLFRYQLLMLEKRDLEELGYLSEGKIITLEEGKIEIEMDPHLATPILERKVSSGEVENLLVIGSFFLGFELNSRFEKIEGRRLIMNVGKKTLLPFKEVSVLPPESSILKTSPWFLSRISQKELFKLERWGFEKDERAKTHSVIQLLESVFGRKNIRRERDDIKRENQ